MNRRNGEDLDGRRNRAETKMESRYKDMGAFLVER